MSGSILRAAFRGAALLASTSCTATAWAQVTEDRPPVRQSLDENGVNVATGTYRLRHGDLALGSGMGRIVAGGYKGSIALDRLAADGVMDVGTPGRSYRFRAASDAGGYVALDGGGATLEALGDDVYRLTLADGARYTYGFVVRDRRLAAGTGDAPMWQEVPRIGLLTTIEHPDGQRVSLSWEQAQWCTTRVDASGWADNLHCQPGTNDAGSVRRAYRITAIANGAAFRIDYHYAGATIGFDAPSEAEIDAWSRSTGYTGRNGARVLQQVVSRVGTVDAHTEVEEVTDPLGRVARYEESDAPGAAYVAVRRPGSPVDTLRVTMGAGNRVTSVVRDGATWTYAYAEPAAGLSRMTVTDPVGRTRRYTYDGAGRLLTTTAPGGQLTGYTYDTRGNVLRTTVTPANGNGNGTGTGGATLVTRASYAATCADAVTCNLPLTTTDVRGLVTSYAYDPVHGGVTSVVVRDAAGTILTTAQTRYAQVNGVWLPVKSWTCRTTTACEGTADAVQTTIAYDVVQQPLSVTRGAGDGSVQATTTTSNTYLGDVLAVDGPLPGSDDTTRSFYDAGRQLLGEIGADPDGAGPLPRRARRIGYDAQGRTTSVSIGTATEQSAAALAAMTVAQVRTLTLDAAGRTVSEALSAAGTILARTDRAYDAAGRPTCTAVRMTAAGLARAGDACVATPGAAEPDRITRIDYAPAGAGRPDWTRVTMAYGTPAASTETTRRGADGTVASVTDGNGNRTAYGYDGLGRLATTTWSDGSSERLVYDAQGDVVSRRLRDGTAIGYRHDALGRVVATDRPGRRFAYDRLGAMVRATDASGRELTFGYDALGRKLWQGDNRVSLGNARFGYDAGGRRTRLTWSDGAWVGYDWRVTGELGAIRGQDGGGLAAFGYDGLGRRTELARANGTATRYGYDAASRLAGLTQDLAGTGSDEAVTLGRNAAGQIARRTGSNDAYAWRGGYAVDRRYVANGLNQYVSAGGVALGYDGRGNLTRSGEARYGYTADDRLARAPGVVLEHDPLGRLATVAAAGRARVALAYDGSELIGEVDADTGAVLRRYVYGPQVDEPLLWYEGSGLAQRRWLHADERGSVIAVADDAGRALRINRYDEFGIPAPDNLGRFGYTGQKWLPEVGLYDYKARMYSPTLGRFLQTDPTGTADGLNLYDYVHGDPVNATDPTGLMGLPMIGKCEDFYGRKDQQCELTLDLFQSQCINWLFRRGELGSPLE